MNHAITTTTLTRTCIRCGAAMSPLAEVARLAGVVASAAGAAAVEEQLAYVRLAKVDQLVASLRDFARDAPRLAAALACHAATCQPKAAEEPSTTLDDSKAERARRGEEDAA